MDQVTVPKSNLVKKHRFNHQPALPNDKYFEYLANVYTNIKSSKGIVGPVLVETAGDETVTISKVQWDLKSDECWGFCGKKGPSHECDPAFVHVIGDEDDAYNRLQGAFKDNKIAGYACVIMLNPIHKDIPPIVVLLQACCNKFTHDMVKQQLEAITNLYNKHLLPILGLLVGNASDDHSRRMQKAIRQKKEVDTP